MSTNFPHPGSPVRGSKSGKPIMALFDLLGRSWSLGIIWQLSNGGFTFRQLQNQCETISPTVLNKRLKELNASGIIERGDDGYQLSTTGLGLFELLEPFGQWSQTWADKLENKNS